MSVYLKSGFAAAILGLGIFASAGSAYAAGCLSPDQTRLSLTDHTDTAHDQELASETKGYRCNVAPTGQQQAQAQQQQQPVTNAKAGSHAAY